jgi:hypothetical protein
MGKVETIVKLRHVVTPAESKRSLGLPESAAAASFKERSSGLEYCPYNAHLTDSENHARIESNEEIRPQAQPLNHRKPDSSPQGAQF